MEDCTPVFYNPSGNGMAYGLACGFTGGGPIANWFIPCFQALAATGTTIEVHFLAKDAATLQVNTYNIGTTPTGVAGLTRNAGAITFVEDCPSLAFGYIAYARGGSVLIGRFGDTVPHVNGLYCRDTPSLPESLAVGDAFAWCLVADAHGWAVDFIENTAGFGGGNGTLDYINGALSNTALAVKAGPGQINGYKIFNPDTVANFIAFYDALAANVTVGTTVPKFILPLAAGATANLSNIGKSFSTGISIAAASSFNGAGAPATAQQVSIDFQ